MLHSDESAGTPFDARPNGAARAKRNEANQQAPNRQEKKLEELIAEAATLLTEPNQKLESLQYEYVAEFRPVGVHQQMLVRELAYADWRIQQAVRIETGLLWLQVGEIYNYQHKPPMEVRWDIGPKPVTPPPPSITKATAELRTLLMGAAWIQNPKLFGLLIRVQNSARRDYFRALKQLEAVRTGKAEYLPKDPKPQAKPVPNETKPVQPKPQTAAATKKDETNPTQPAPQAPIASHVPIKPPSKADPLVRAAPPGAAN